MRIPIPVSSTFNISRRESVLIYSQSTVNTMCPFSVYLTAFEITFVISCLTLKPSPIRFFGTYEETFTINLIGRLLSLVVATVVVSYIISSRL